MSKPFELCPARLELVAAPDALEIQAAEGEGKPPTFAGVVYTGGPMQLNGFYRPVIVDLAGMKAGQENPVYKQHDPNQIVGHTTAVPITPQRITVEGVVSGTGAAAQEVVANARNKFPWKLSLGASVDRLVRVDDGESVQVNGRTFRGPVLIARKTTLGEVSFVPRGADAKTKVKVAATIAAEPLFLKGNAPMTFEQWLKAKGFDSNLLTESGLATLRASYDDEQRADAGAKPADDATGAKPIQAAAVETADEIKAAAATGLDEFRKEAAAETRRIGAIQAAAKDFPEICAEAIEAGWSKEQTEREVTRERELQDLRASRASIGPAIHIEGAGDGASALVLECAARMNTSEDRELVEKDYDEKILAAAHKHFRRLGFKDLIRACCDMEHVAAPRPGATETDYIRAAFSTTSLSGILGDSANKSMLAAYRAVPSTAKKIARKLSANDFKTHTGYRLTGDPKLLEVDGKGELKYGNLDEESFTYSVATYGKIFGITREMIVNDDLNAFSEIPRLLGKGAALTLEDLFWTLVLANTGSFFASGNNNTLTNSLSSAGLAAAVALFRNQTDADGHPVLLTPTTLVVPPALEETADELYTSTNIVLGTSTKAKVGSANTHKAKYKPEVSPYISNSSYTGYSTTRWYLFPEKDESPFGIAYLNGAENPIVEEADQPAEFLGKAWRGYTDLGVCQVDSRCGVMSDGDDS